MLHTAPRRRREGRRARRRRRLRRGRVALAALGARPARDMKFVRKDGVERSHSMTAQPHRRRPGRGRPATSAPPRTSPSGCGRRRRWSRRWRPSAGGRAAARGRPGQGRLRLQRQPRAAHADHQHRRLPRDARGRRVRRRSTAAQLDARAPGERPTARRLLSLIDDLLTLSRVEDDGLALDRPGLSTCARLVRPAHDVVVAGLDGAARSSAPRPARTSRCRSSATATCSSGWWSTWSATR